jgi:UPF0716 protein FxsA
MSLLKTFIIAEIIVFLLVIAAVGFLNTFLLLAFTSVIGFVFLTRSGARNLISQNGNNREAMMMAMMTSKGKINLTLLVAGMLLLLPGFITDVLGLACLIPLFRKKLFNKVMKQQFSQFSTPNGPTRKKTSVIEGEFIKQNKNDT